MSLQGVRSCGDYMFSGHTVIVTLLNFFNTECEYVGAKYMLQASNLGSLRARPVGLDF